MLRGNVYQKANQAKEKLEKVKEYADSAIARVEAMRISGNEKAIIDIDDNWEDIFSALEI